MQVTQKNYVQMRDLQGWKPVTKIFQIGNEISI